jgi:phospholipase/carboxylesterase
VFDEDDLRRQADNLAEFLTIACAAYGFEDRSLVAVGFSNGANMASALLLERPSLIGAAVLLSAMVPYAQPPHADLSGTLVVISNGERDPLIPPGMTDTLAGQLRERRAEVVLLPHPDGHRIDPSLLPQIGQLIARPERPNLPHHE